MTNKKYTIRNKYLANSLAFLGFRYEVQPTSSGMMFVFEDTEQFREYLTSITDLKKKKDNQ